MTPLPIEVDKHLIPDTADVMEALGALNSLSGSRMTLFVRNDEGKIKGTVTDGDIRRALLGGIPLSTKVSEIMNKDFLSAHSATELPEKVRIARKRGIRILPLLFEEGIKSLIDVETYKAPLPIDAVLMAGGRGERLRPLTDKTPKPLLKVGDSPIIDHNVIRLEQYGIENIFVTVNYLAEMIIDHFAERANNSTIRCIKEPSRLGTIGSLSLIDDFESDDILVMNSDLLTDIDFEALWNHHKERNADLTMCSVPYTVSVPYAILNIEGERVKGLEEKPSFNYLANAGVYLMKRETLARLKRGEYMDAPDFIATLIAGGAVIASFTIEGRWIDIGSPEDYRYADSLLKK